MNKKTSGTKKKNTDTNLVTYDPETGEYNNSFLLNDADDIPPITMETKKIILKSLINDYNMDSTQALKLVKSMT